MDLNYIIALTILATKNQDVEQFRQTYQMVIDSATSETDLKYKNKEIINAIFNIYEVEIKGKENIIAYINFVNDIAVMFQGLSTNYYKYKMLADIMEYPLSSKLELIKLLDDNVGDIEERKEVLYLKLNAYNHELNYVEIENLISKIRALDV